MARTSKAILITSTLLAGGLALAGAAQLNQGDAAGEPDASAQAQSTEIGVVEREVVFQNYAGAEKFRAQSQDLQQQFTKAQQQGDQQKLREIQARFTQLQTELQQKFERDLGDAAAKLADEKDLDFVVAEVVYQSDAVSEVDLTETLIEKINAD